MHQVDKVHTYVVENLFALPHIARKRHDVHRTAHRMPWRNIVCISAVCLVEPDHKRPLEARVGYFAVLPLQLEFRGESPELLGRREAGVVLKCGVLREEVPEGIGFFWIGSLALTVAEPAIIAAAASPSRSKLEAITATSRRHISYVWGYIVALTECGVEFW